mgnify:FL=1
MALPKLNDSPSYELIVPSTGKTVNYRPYLVKEEKVLMIAFESGDTKHSMREIGNTLNACLHSAGINVFDLTTFDVEYMFTQIRSKAVGEVANVLVACKSCGHKNEYELDVTDIKVSKPLVEENVIQLTTDVVVELEYPTYGAVCALESLGDKDTVSQGFEMAKLSLKTIKTEEDRFNVKDYSKKEITEFVESMTTDQFQKISNFLTGIPAVTYEDIFECSSCKEVNEIKLKGMKDFL